MRIRNLALVGYLSVCLLTGGSLTLLLTRHALHVQSQEAVARLQAKASEIGRALDDHVNGHRRSLAWAAKMLGEGGRDDAEWLNAMRKHHPGFLSVLVTDHVGLIRQLSFRDDLQPPAPMSELIGSSVADRDYFRVPMESRAGFVSNVFKGRGLGDDWIVGLSEPILSPLGTFLGVVEGSLDLEALDDLLESDPALSPTRLRLTDRSGTVIVSLGADGPLVGPNAVAHVNDSGWNVHLALEPGYSSALVKRHVRFALQVAFGLLLVALVMDWLLARRLSRPIESLLRAISAHRPESEISFAQTVSTAPDEVKQMADSFQQLALRLSETLARQRAMNVEETRLRIELEHEVASREAVIAERTRTIAERNEDLKNLAHQALQAAESKSVFLATMSHEMRTPLAAIIGFGELIERQLRQSDLDSDHVDRLRYNAERLQQTIERILELSALDSGEIAIEPRDVVLRDLVSAICDRFSFDARRKGLTLEIEGDLEGEDHILVDPDRLNVILEQLVSNAVKFTHQGGVVVEFQSHNPVDWQVSVRDTGIGIPANERNRITRPFEQLDQRDDRRHGGAGLGLAIAQQTCRLMDLELVYQDAEPFGTIATVRPSSDTSPV